MPNEFVPKKVDLVGEPDQYGNNGYSVMFSNGQNAFMKAQRAPEVGKPEWGEIIDAPKKSGNGTYKKFKRMPREDAQASSSAPRRSQGSSKPDTAINRMSAIKTAAQAVQAGVDYDTLKSYAEQILAWIEDGEVEAEKPKLELPANLRKSTTSEDLVPIDLYTPDQEPEVDLDAIPF